METTPNASHLYDVIIIGAGLSGIGTAYWLEEKCPGKRYLILEARQEIGGTWDLFRYPGIRSDSDMFTFGYAFRPWKSPQSLAEGDAILQYISETARESGIDQHIRFGHRLIRASWSSEDAVWTLEVSRSGAEQGLQIRTRFLYMCSGYYNYEEAHRPSFPGEEDFRGKIVLPQFWPEDLDYTGKKVVVVGSGATAVTLVPAMAPVAKHVTMLQRSPTYIMPLPNKNGTYLKLKKWLPDRWAFRITRWRNLLLSMGIYQYSRRFPERMKNFLMKIASEQIGPEFDVKKHLNPSYRPWDQRLCVIPNADLFKTIRSGKASIITDHIEQFTPNGLQLKSGDALEADLIVLATGLKIKLLGGAELEVDGQAIQTQDLMAYKGMMMSGLPNFAVAFGYTNASWTLKTDLTANYICRLLQYMDRHGYTTVVPQHQPDVARVPFLNFNAGYIQRANAIMPYQGARRPWRVYQNYLQDMLTIRYGRINDGVLAFT